MTLRLICGSPSSEAGFFVGSQLANVPSEAAEPPRLVLSADSPRLTTADHWGQACVMTDVIDAFLADCSRTLTERAATATVDRDAAVAGASALAVALDAAVPQDFEPGWLPVLETIDQVEDTDLGRRLVAIASDLPWTPTLRANDGGTRFALSPINQARDLGDVIVGLMYVAPGEQYPMHRHSPQELYLTLSGTARWRFGGNEDVAPVGPLETIYNHPNDLHSALAGDSPLVALYVLWPDG